MIGAALVLRKRNSKHALRRLPYEETCCIKLISLDNNTDLPLTNVVPQVGLKRAYKQLAQPLSSNMPLLALTEQYVLLCGVDSALGAFIVLLLRLIGCSLLLNDLLLLLVVPTVHRNL